MAEANQSLASRLARFVLTRWSTRAAYRFVLRDLRPVLEMPQAALLLETKRFSQLIRPVPMHGPSARRVVVVAPHPDDDIFGPGGTLLHLAAAGVSIRTIYVTDGTTRDPAQLRGEAMEACRAIAAEPVFLGLPLRNIPLDAASVERFRSAIAGFTPDAIFIPFLLDDHDDHRRVNELLQRAFPSGGLSAEVWAYQVYSSLPPNVVVDITDVAERKRDLVRLWRHANGERNWAHFVLGTNAANCRHIAGTGEIYAETFFVVPGREYLDLCARYFSGPAGRVYREANYVVVGASPS